MKKRNLDITEQTINCFGDLEVDLDKGFIEAAYELWFDVDRYFGTDTRDKDDTWINFYTRWHPDRTITAKSPNCLNSGEEAESDWIPVGTGLFPRDNENVQITYLGFYDHTPHCDGIAYRKSGKWHWALDDSNIVVPITAWKQNCKAYKETEADKAWVPVNTGLFPEEQEAVQVTYLGYNDNNPHCDAFAFLEDGKWYWSLDEGDVKVPIIAWKQTGEAYQ